MVGYGDLCMKDNDFEYRVSHSSLYMDKYYIFDDLQEALVFAREMVKSINVDNEDKKATVQIIYKGKDEEDESAV